MKAATRSCGLPGAVNHAVIRRIDGTEEIVFKATNVELAAGDSVVFQTAGGGGYGDPDERDRVQLAADIEARIVSVDAAKHHYGYIASAEVAG